MNSITFLSLLLPHIIGDFYLQSDKLCKQKQDLKFRSPFLYIHALIIAALSWIFIPQVDFILMALIIAFSHFVIDAIKSFRHNTLSAFVIDQILHLSVIAAIASIYDGPESWIAKLPSIGNTDIVAIAIAILISLKPANILIKLILEKYKVGESESCKEITSAGALIGNLERILTIIFVIIGHYDAIGFIIAAKSILRFKDTDTAKTEYVLAGTFLSFGIAIICGLFAL
jgi:hypothetical protein